MTSRVMFVTREACCTSTCGACPETVTVSASVPTFISPLTVSVVSATTSTSARTCVLKPVSANVTL